MGVFSLDRTGAYGNHAPTNLFSIPEQIDNDELQTRKTDGRAMHARRRKSVAHTAPTRSRDKTFGIHHRSRCPLITTIKPHCHHHERTH
jgi:hypothetical protein